MMGAQHHDTIIDERRHHFYQVDNELVEIYLPRIGTHAFAIYNVLVCYAYGRRSVIRATTKIAEVTGLSKPTILQKLRVLEEEKLISIEERTGEGGGNLAHIYHILDVPKAERPENPIVKQERKTERGGKATLPPGKATLPGAGSQMALPPESNGLTPGSQMALPPESSELTPEGKVALPLIILNNNTFENTFKQDNNNTATLSQIEPEASVVVVSLLQKNGVTVFNSKRFVSDAGPVIPDWFTGTRLDYLREQIAALRDRKPNNPGKILTLAIEEGWDFPDAYKDRLKPKPALRVAPPATGPPRSKGEGAPMPDFLKGKKSADLINLFGAVAAEALADAPPDPPPL